MPLAAVFLLFFFSVSIRGGLLHAGKGGFRWLPKPTLVSDKCLDCKIEHYNDLISA